MQENGLQLGAAYCRHGGAWQAVELCVLSPWRRGAGKGALQIVVMAARGNERVKARNK
jgi:hypothetical protein